MNDQYLKEWMEKVERRLEALEGKSVKEAPPAPPPTAPVEFPRWIYRRNPTSGEVEAMVAKSESDLPADGNYADSPADLEEIEIEQAILEPEKEPEPESTPKASEPEAAEIPEDWKEMDFFKMRELAKTLPGGDQISNSSKKDDVIALIEMVLEDRGNAE